MTFEARRRVNRETGSAASRRSLSADSDVGHDGSQTVGTARLCRCRACRCRDSGRSGSLRSRSGGITFADDERARDAAGLPIEVGPVIRRPAEAVLRPGRRPSPGLLSSVSRVGLLTTGEGLGGQLCPVWKHLSSLPRPPPSAPRSAASPVSGTPITVASTVANDGTSSSENPVDRVGGVLAELRQHVRVGVYRHADLGVPEYFHDRPGRSLADSSVHLCETPG